MPTETLVRSTVSPPDLTTCPEISPPGEPAVFAEAAANAAPTLTPVAGDSLSPFAGGKVLAVVGEGVTEFLPPLTGGASDVLPTTAGFEVFTAPADTVAFAATFGAAGALTAVDLPVVVLPAVDLPAAVLEEGVFAATDTEEAGLDRAGLESAGLAINGFSFTAGVLGGGAVVDLALLATAALTALADPPADAAVFDDAFNDAAEAFEDFFVVALDLAVDACERDDEVLAADLVDFASFFEDAILIAP